MKFFANALFCFLAALFFAACASTEKDNQPERDKISAMPHNLPASWEGQAGMGGAFNQEY